MGIISEYVDIKVNAYTCNYYSNRGYDIPKKINKNGKLVIDCSKTISICVSDLPINSHQIIQISCDCCGKQINVIYQNYNKILKKHGEYLCRKCANKKYNSGQNNCNWNPELSDEDRKLKRSVNEEYKELIKKVFHRDNYICQCCGRHAKKLNAHHKNGYSWYIEGRYDVNNCVTLCDNCHINFHTIYGKSHNTQEQYIEWLEKSKIELEQNGGYLSPGRKIISYEDGKIYDSTRKAAEINGYKSTTNINAVCNHKEKYNTAYGKHWFWYEEYINMTEEEIQYYVSK